MVIIEDLNFDLVVFTPYRSLVSFLREADLGDEVGLRAWTVLNDSYRTDVILLHPPHLVARACLQLGCVHFVQEQQIIGTNVECLTSSQPQLASSLIDKLKVWTESLTNIDFDQVMYEHA